MMRRSTALLAMAGVIALLACTMVNSADRPADNVGKKVSAFTLSDPRDGKKVSLGDLKDKKAIVVVFLGTECPISNGSVPTLIAMHKDYADNGVAFVAINSNVQDEPARVAEHAKKNAIPFPVLKDEKNVVADEFEAVRTPEAFVIAPDGAIRYRGRINDELGYGVQRPKATTHELADAIDAVLAGKPVAVKVTAVEGCRIGRVAKTTAAGEVTYAKHVAPIIQQHCQECHRPGQIGPFSLMDYKKAVAWSETIREVVEDRRMPPWHADPKFGKFSNDRSLSNEERATLLKWIDTGMAKGDDKDMPKPREFAADWRIGKPDLVITMKDEFEVPADGGKNGVPYKYFSVDPGLKEDIWVQKAEAKPGNPAVVHHIIAFVVAPGMRFNPEAPTSVLCGTAPGDMPLIVPEGTGKKIVAGSRFVFQMHYTPNGTATRDRSSIGLILAKEKPKYQVFTRPVDNRLFTTRLKSIPPGEENYEIVSEWKFPEDGHILSFMPHMHLRGKDFLIEAIDPDGKTETILSVPKYQFGWQSAYRYDKPVAMPKGSKVRCTAHFDNSAKNPNNPDPTKRVFWGDQTWEEMMIGWMDYHFDRQVP